MKDKGGVKMQSVGDRIVLILQNAGKKQKDLAELLSITSASVSTMCSGKTNPSSQSIILICKEFGVNRTWLETGEGEMYQPTTDNERLSEYIGELLKGSVETDIRLRLISCLSKLSEDEWKILYKLAQEWTQEDKKEEGQA